MDRLIFATGNQNKLKERKEIFADLPFEIVSMKDAGIISDPDENDQKIDITLALLDEAIQNIENFDDAVVSLDNFELKGNVLKLIVEVYQKDFGFSPDSFKYRLSLRDKNNKEKYIDNDEMWETAESQLRQILNELNIEFYEAEGEAAFYGPKIDIQIKTALGHDVTIPTCQLDFALPERFDLTFIGEDGNEHRPVVIHRAILGSSDRFISFLIEETKGAIPTWLSPVQVKILPIADRHLDYANEVKKQLLKEHIRVEVDDRSEKVGYKIREAQLQKVPYMLILGDKEQEAKAVGVRARQEGDIGAMELDKFIQRIKEEIIH